MKDRRQFLKDSGSLIGSVVAASQVPGLFSLYDEVHERLQRQAPFENLTDEEAAEITALAEMIIPATDTPGATDAGVVYFIDLAVAEGEPFSAVLPVIRSGLAELKESSAKLAGKPGLFSELSNDQRISLMDQIVQTPFFGLIKTLTVLGYLSHPRHAGNRDAMGWKVIGFESRHAWQPPFGYYDARYEEDADG